MSAAPTDLTSGAIPSGWPDPVAQRLSGAAFFAALSPAQARGLFAACELLTASPSEPLLPEFDPETGQREAPTPLLFMVEGEGRVHGRVYGVERTLNFVRRGEVFYNRTYTEDERAELQVTSMSPAVAVAIPAKALDEVLSANAAFKEGFLAQLEEARERKARYFNDPNKARVTSFVLEERLLPTNRVKVLRHDLCVECDACYDACAERHGVSRLWPSDIHYGVLSVPANCHNCHYPTCESACKFDVLRYDDDEDELRVSHNCVGCQQCSRSCSYGAITMVPFDLIDPAYLTQRDPNARGGRMYAVKCDNCAGYDELACVSACPTGALFQVDGAQLVDLLEELGPEGTNPKALARLNPEPWPWFRWLCVGGFAAVSLAASYEVMGWYHWPGATITDLLHQRELIALEVPRDTEYPYRAGNDLSLLLGYSATGLVLGAQLYRVRKALPWLGGDMRLWMHTHVWMSLTALVLAFWHLAFSVVNLSAVAWWSFVVIICTGLVGALIHTRVPRHASGRELELAEVEEQLAKLTHTVEGYFATPQDARLAMGTHGGGARRSATTMTRLQDLKGLSGGEGAAGHLTGVFNLLQADLAALKDRDEVQRRAARRAGVSGESKAKLERLLAERERLEGAVAHYETLRGVSRMWHVVHRVFSYLFFVSLALHIGFQLIW